MALVESARLVLTKGDLSMKKPPSPSSMIASELLREASQDIERLSLEIEKGHRDDYCPLSLQPEFGHIMHNLCLAWHHMWLSDTQLKELPDEELEAMMTRVSNWGDDLTLVEIDD